MCGLTYFTGDVNNSRKAAIFAQIEELLRRSIRRGSDAVGVIVYVADRTYEFREDRPNMKRVRAFLRNIFRDSTIVGQTITVIAHARMRTNGASNVANIQPIRKAPLVLAHNGILINEDAFTRRLRSQFHEDDVQTWSDTKKALYSIGCPEKVSQLNATVVELFSDFDGANNAILHSEKHDSTYFFTTHGSLYLKSTNSYFACSSEPGFLEAAFGLSEPVNKIENNIVYKLSSFELQAISGVLNTQRIKSVNPMPVVGTSEYSKFTRLLIDNTELVNSIPRCKSCLMPTTVPFIKIDDSGTCVYCRSETVDDWVPDLKLAELDEKLSHQQRILFPFSGGRDSSFGLVKLRERYEGEIIAYTYDWGMVTDLARRNISSLCGEFGIEHVLISANLQKKLKNVRKNVQAWLKQPNLGVVPLFMAGDKQYFFYINELARERDINLSLLCSNPFERTNFKSGFCGVDANKSSEEKYFSLSAFDKLKMLGFYGAQYAKNYRYLNESILDTIGAFISYYGIKHEYEGLFDYYQWREEEVEAVLSNALRWEYAADTASSWRIGDGTAPFYNYIYLNMAGFTENDALRSNQVRAGHLSREAAFALLKRDNMNRAESLFWYFKQIGVDPIGAIEAFHLKLNSA